jgi:hypothetical protein
LKTSRQLRDLAIRLNRTGGALFSGKEKTAGHNIRHGAQSARSEGSERSIEVPDPLVSAKGGVNDLKSV